MCCARPDRWFARDSSRVAVFFAAALCAAAAHAGSVAAESGSALEGLYDARARLKPVCVTPIDLALAPPPATIAGTYTACQSLSATGVEVVSPGVTFASGQRIVLEHAFGVSPGEPFAAVIDRSLDGSIATLTDTSPEATSTYKARLFVRFDGLNLAAGDRLDHLAGYSLHDKELFKLIVQRSPAPEGFELVLWARQNDGSQVDTQGSAVPLAPGWNRILLDWSAAPGQGYFKAKVNGAPAFVGLTGLDNDLRDLELIRWGLLGGRLDGSSGNIELDDYTSWR